MAYSALVANDSANGPSYTVDATGAWKGLNSSEGENPLGNDDGGSGFQPWDFRGGYHNPTLSPYGNLNHFIDGVDFPQRHSNDLGSPVFGLTNAGTLPAHGLFGFTARATRVFDTPLQIGQTLSLDFDNPSPQPLDQLSRAGFLFRLNKGGGPIIDSSPLPGVVERFGLFTASNFNDGRWYTTDSEQVTDTALAPAATASGTTISFTLTGVETYLLELRRLLNSELLFSRSGTLNSPGSGSIDTMEIALFNNGSSETGSREFFFNKLRIESPPEFVPGDYNRNGEVDAADYVLWRDTLTQSVPAGSGADGNSSGVIDTLDYALWRRGFGNTAISAKSPAANSVPEPVGISSVLFACAFISWAVLCRCRTCF